MMFDDFIIPSMTIIGFNRRLTIVIILLTSLAVILVITSIAAFIYVTRKGFFQERNNLRVYKKKNISFRKSSSKISFNYCDYYNINRISISSCCC